MDLTSNTTTNPLTRIRNHFSSIVNGSLSPSSRKEVTVKEFANFLTTTNDSTITPITPTALYRAEEGLIYEIPTKILHGYSVYLSQSHGSRLHSQDNWSALTAWFEQSRLHPKEYHFFAANNTVTVNGHPNPLWEEIDPVLYENTKSYLSLLWELHVLDSLNYSEYPWDKNNNLINNVVDATPLRLNSLLKDITAINGTDNSAYWAARILKMSSWPLEKFVKNEMKSVPVQFVNRIRLWWDIQESGYYNTRRQIILDQIDYVLGEINAHA